MPRGRRGPGVSDGRGLKAAGSTDEADAKLEEAASFARVEGVEGLVALLPPRPGALAALQRQCQRGGSGRRCGEAAGRRAAAAARWWREKAEQPRPREGR